GRARRRAARGRAARAPRVRRTEPRRAADARLDPRARPRPGRGALPRAEIELRPGALRGAGNESAMIVATLLALLCQAPAPAKLLKPPEGWRGERLEFPLDFAPEIELRGSEELAFAPGMFTPDSDSYFSYALALHLDGEIEIDAPFLRSFL